MSKRLVVLAVFALCTVLMFGGCAQSVGDTLDNVGSTIGNAVGQLLSGDVTGETGKVYSTQWFSFNVKSIKEVPEYAGYTPEDGYVLYDVLITETCTFDESIPMGTFDFYMDDDSFSEPIYPIAPLDDTMMPDQFDLGADETVEYHMIYEVPAEHTALKLMYTEVDEADNIGVTFTINIDS
ncbi:MAG: hypothetical protein LBV27_00645 [Oscillospiraceae bacterium]|nr:hypothetical protein [Oscillospiraceae bacterium]